MTRIRSLCSLILTTACLATAHAYNWEEVPPGDLTTNECSYDSNAAAEVLYKEIIYDLNDLNVRFISTHVRTKIYEKSALDYARRTKFWYSAFFKPSRINARVIKPDGSYVEIEDKDVSTQTESKSSERTLKSTTISIPQVEVGDIVEYRYTISLKQGYYLPKDEVSFQEEWPIRKLVLKMKPYGSYRGRGFKWASHGTKQPLKEGNQGFYEITLENQPGYPDEPYQAPDSDAKAWFAFYNVGSLTNGDNFWKNEGKRLYKKMLSDTKADKTVEAKAAQLAANLKTDEAKLRAFYHFCKSSLINSDHGTADSLTQDQRDDLDETWAADKTLEKGYGTPRNINTVYCALARAVGIDARLSPCADRSDYNFTKVIEDVEIALPDTLVAIPDGKNWIFHNPGAKYMPFGQLDWYHDNVGALVPDKKKLILTQTQAAPPEQNRAISIGRFELSPNGNLSGKFEITLEGNNGFIFKQQLDGQSENERIESIKDVLTKSWPNGKMENMLVENADSPFAPFKITCDLTIPNYAESVGSRIFLQPNVEERYSEAEFPSPVRKTMIFFDFKYRDESDIEIKLPEGYVLEAASAPLPFSVAGLFEYAPKLSINQKTNTLIYKRTLDFTADKYPPQAYPIIKNSFDNLLTQDHHALTLKRDKDSSSANETEKKDS